MTWTWPRVWWLLVLAVIASLALRFGAPHARGSRAATEWGELSHCLFGGPLAEGELPSTRMRNIALAAMAQTAPKHFEQWPASCQGSATRLLEALDEEGKKGTALGRTVRDLPGSLSSKPEVFLAQFSWFDALAAAAEAEGLGAVGARAELEPPAAPAKPWRSADLPPFTRGQLAPPEAIASAPDVVLVDYGYSSWSAPSVGALRLVGVPGAAVLLLDAKPIRALRIEDGGHVAPLVADEH